MCRAEFRQLSEEHKAADEDLSCQSLTLSVILISIFILLIRKQVMLLNRV